MSGRLIDERVGGLDYDERYDNSKHINPALPSTPMRTRGRPSWLDERLLDACCDCPAVRHEMVDGVFQSPMEEILCQTPWRGYVYRMIRCRACGKVFITELEY